MDFLTLLLFALGLSVDSFAVSVSGGLALPGIRFIQALRISFILALFQGGIMLMAGWGIGINFRELVQDWDHWIAFGLLALIGMKMIWEGLKDAEERNPANLLKWVVLMGVALATSIDSLGVGLSFALLQMNIFWAGFVIGAVTFLAGMTGLFFGKKIGGRFSHRLEVIGGLVLIGVGVKILIIA